MLFSDVSEFKCASILLINCFAGSSSSDSEDRLASGDIELDVSLLTDALELEVLTCSELFGLMNRRSDISGDSKLLESWSTISYESFTSC